jgi:hypothetical protein
MAEPKWKEFEKLVARIQADFIGTGVVTHDDKLMGAISGVERQIDISIRSKVGQYDILIVIDCKDYGRPLDVTDIEQFRGLSRDVRANKAAMVAAKGFSAAAQTVAVHAGIELYTVVDTGDHPWKTGVSVPALYERSGITEIGFESECTSRYIGDGDIPVGEIELFDLTGASLGKFQDLIHAKWNRGEFPYEPGYHGNLEIVSNPVKVHDYTGILHEMTVRASIQVETRRYFGYLKLTQVSGLHNVVTGATLTKRMVTESVGPDLEKRWTRIHNLDDLAVRPVMTFGCAACYGPDADLDLEQDG